MNKTKPNPETFAHPKSELALHVGEDVYELLAKESIQSAWDALYDACPWATVFQSRAFVTTWYHTYGSGYLPILVKSVEGGKLTGLLPLARNESGLIIGAGENQSEYQVWLATDSNGDGFIKKAIIEIQKRFAGDKVQLNYIPGNAPMKWIEEDPVLKKYCFVRTFKQPLMKIDDVHISNELRKKNRREKINRLKRIGELKFECITDGAIFSSVIDELTLQYDFRKIAMHNTAFFLNDSLRKRFLLSLFEQKLLHVTVLKLNEEIIASNVSIAGRNWVHLQGINTHAPYYAKYSPGILHFLMLGKQLAKEGIEIFDLTPGGDSYKEGLATDYALTYKLCIGSIYSHFVDPIKLKIVEQLKKMMVDIGMKPRILKKKALVFFEKMKHAKTQGLYFSITNIIREIGASRKSRKYVAHPDALMQSSGLLSINKNSLCDFLHYEAEGTWKTRWEFLAEAMHRFEVGQSAYTFCQQGRLLGCVWLSDGAGTSGTGTTMAGEAALLQGFYYHPQGRDKLQDFLIAVVAAVVRERKESQVYALTTFRDKTLCQTLESIGFKSTV